MDKKKYLLTARIYEIILALCFLFMAFGVFSVYSQAKNPSVVQDEGVLKYKYEKLKADYDAVVKDRDNILSQIKNLLQYKAKFNNAEIQMKRLSDYNDKIEKDKQELNDKISMLNDEIKNLNQQVLARNEQIGALKKHIENMEIEYKIVGITKKKLKETENNNRKLEAQIQKLNLKIHKMEGEKIEAKASAEAYRRQLRDVSKQYRQALSKNRKLEKKLDYIPRKFSEMARENKMLLKETALMHYNLGVFYMEHKEYRRAIAEFRKSLDLNPDDAYTHFNLGYIYAQYLVNRPKAIEHFRQFLRLSKKSDKDVDWVKKYILTWQAWEGKEPIK